jgi:LysM repeat protein
MRVRTWSACVVLAWGILLIITAAGPIGSLRPAQATTRIASSTSTTSNTSTTTTITTQATLTSSVTSTSTGDPTAGPAGRPGFTVASAMIGGSAARPAARAGSAAGAEAATRVDAAVGALTAARAVAGTGGYVVRPGDTLSGIAAALGIPGGWPALYAANRRAVGPDPGLIRLGAVLVLPGRAAPARYTVSAGDTLSGIAAALATPGGWPALYAANRRVIGTDPNAIQAGTVLVIPRGAPARPSAPSRHQATAGSPAPRPAPTPTKAPASAPPSASSQPSASTRSTAAAQPPTPTAANGHPRPAQANPSAVAGLPRWLEIELIAAGLLIGTAFLTEPTLAIARRRRAARPDPAGTRIVLADYDRLVVTHCGTDGTVYVLRPPGADPQAILLAARLVLAQDRYEELAGQLGVPAHWPRE